MEKSKQSLKTIFAEALEYYKRRDFKTAEVFCYKILSIDHNHFDSISLLANIFGVNRNFDKAKEFLEQAIEIAPNFEEALNNLGTIYHRERNYIRAIELFERALEVNPESFPAQVNLCGSVFARIGRNLGSVHNSRGRVRSILDK